MANEIGLIEGFKTKKPIDKVFKKKQISSVLSSKGKFRKKTNKNL